jgi:hypothetical protein
VLPNAIGAQRHFTLKPAACSKNSMPGTLFSSAGDHRILLSAFTGTVPARISRHPDGRAGATAISPTVLRGRVA